MTPRDIALATLPPALWAVAYAIAKPVTQTFPPLLLMSIVYAITTLALWRPWTERQTPLWAVLVAATLGASFQSALIFSGIAHVPATMAILTVQSQVPFAVLASWLIGQESLNGQRVAGIAFSLAGVALVVGMPESFGEVSGLVLIVLGTFCWGIAQGVLRATSKDAGGPLMGLMSAVAAPQLLLMSLLLETGQEEALLNASLSDWLALLTLAIGGFVAAYSIWYSLLRTYRVDQIAPFILLMPVTGILTAFLFLGERPSLAALGGGVIILAGLGLVVRPRKNTSCQAA